MDTTKYFKKLTTRVPVNTEHTSSLSHDDLKLTKKWWNGMNKELQYMVFCEYRDYSKILNTKLVDTVKIKVGDV